MLGENGGGGRKISNGRWGWTNKLSPVDDKHFHATLKGFYCILKQWGV